MRLQRVKKFLLIFILTSVSLFGGNVAQARDLKVLTLNTWLLSILGVHVGKDMKQRTLIIPREIAELNPDLVALQEAWPNHDKSELINEFKKWGYPYSFFVPREVSLGNGLILISKFPMLKTAVKKPFKEITQSDDIFARKTVIYAEIALSPGEHLDFFTTHLGALSYEKDIGAYNPKQRKRQLTQYQEVRDWVMEMHQNPKMILAGDFNGDYRELQGGQFLPEYNPGYQNLIQGSCGGGVDFTNTFLEANHMDASSIPIPTYDYQHNPYAGEGLFSGAPSETEDYIFACGFKPEDITQSSVVLNQPVPADLPELEGQKILPLRLSDHFSVMTTFNLGDDSNFPAELISVSNLQ